MPNIASILKQEISRVARKEARGETQILKKSSAQYRTDIAALKRRVTVLEKQIDRLIKSSAKKTPMGQPEEVAANLRFSAKGLATQRSRLGLSAAQMGLLLGVSVQSIYKWEAGKARPRANQLPAIAQLRRIGKREVTERLKSLSS